MKPIQLLVVLFFIIGLHPASAQTSFTPPVSYFVGYIPFSVIAADVNGDGRVDLVCPIWGDGTISVLTNDGRGGFGSNVVYGAGGQYGPISVVAVDINGTGKTDLACALARAASRAASASCFSFDSRPIRPAFSLRSSRHSSSISAMPLQ